MYLVTIHKEKIFPTNKQAIDLTQMSVHYSVCGTSWALPSEFIINAELGTYLPIFDFF